MGQVVVQAVLVDTWRADHRKQCLDFRGEREHVVVHVVVERQNAEPVAEQVRLAGRRIVYGVGELTAQPLDPTRSILLVLGEKYLGVTTGPKRVRQPGAQLTIIQSDVGYGDRAEFHLVCAVAEESIPAELQVGRLCIEHRLA